MADVNSLKFEQSSVNCKVLKTALGFGVTSLSNNTSMAGGINGVGVMVGVSVTAGVKVIVGASVMVGERVIVGESVAVGVSVIVGEGGKYRKATGSPYNASNTLDASNSSANTNVYKALRIRCCLIL